MFSIPISRLVIASVIVGFLGLSILPSFDSATIANVGIVTKGSTAVLGELFTVDIVLYATEPVNVFKGMLTFDPAILAIDSIDYNTSVADLWAEEPWYSNGDGTLTFIGGTTRSGGFIGEESIVRVTFRGQHPGETKLHMQAVRILRHDGFGTDAPVPHPIDTLFTIASAELEKNTISTKPASHEPRLFVVTETVSTDLNADGKQSIADTSIFMTHLATQNLRSDFNQDGVVNLTDLSILNQE